MEDQKKLIKVGQDNERHALYYKGLLGVVLTITNAYLASSEQLKRPKAAKIF